jgi:hypothetical protein
MLPCQLFQLEGKVKSSWPSSLKPAQAHILGVNGHYGVYGVDMRNATLYSFMV